MHSEPSKIVVTGIIVSAIAIVAYVSQSGIAWVSTEDLGPARSDDPAQRTLGNMVSGVVRSGPAVTHRDSGATTAGAPQAARQGPPRNDPVVAQTQPDVHNNDGQAHVDTGQHATSVARVEKKPQPQSLPRPAPLRTTAPKLKHSHSHETRVAVHGSPAKHAPRNNANDQKALDKLVARLNSKSGKNSNSSNSAPARRESAAGVPVVASQSAVIPAESKAPPSASGAPIAPPLLPPILPTPQTESTSQASPPPALQPAPSESPPVLSGDGPKTRAQVRTEIGRAREDGSLPAFGNPNPAGPGGAPSLTNTPRP